MTAFVKRQLIAFTALSLAAVLIIVFVYAQIPTVLGMGQSRLAAMFTDGAGVYVNSNVTNRGVVIGKVDKITLTPSGVRVDMYYDSDHQIADDARAEIHSVSAVGEIYVDVSSGRAGGPFLEEGAVIPVQRTSVPEQIAPVLDKVTGLLDSIPEAGLRTFLDEGAKAFHNLGPDLRVLVESAENLVISADQHYDETHRLIKDIGPLLDTQVVDGNGANIKEYFADLASFTQAFVDGDEYFRGAIDSVAPAAEGARTFLEDNENTTPILTRNLRTIGHLLGVYRANVEQVLVDYPIADSRLQRALRGQRGLRASFVSALWEDCSNGFKGNDLRNPSDVTDKESAPNQFCKIPHDAQKYVRGARNIPCSEGYVGMRAGTVSECFGRRPDQTPGSSRQPAYTPPPYQAPLPGSQRTPLDPPDNQRNYQHIVIKGGEPMAALGAKSTEAPAKEASWQSMLTDPLSR